MSLENVKVGDWVKIQVTEIDEKAERWMMVSNDENKWKKRKVIMFKNGMYIFWMDAETELEVAKTTRTMSWKFAKELPTEVELTLKQIAEKFGVNVEQIKIKK